MSEAFSIRLPDEQKAFLDKLSKSTDRTRNHLISSAVGKMMDNYNYVLAQIEKGEADIKAGHVHQIAEVERRTKAVLDRHAKKR